MKLILNCITGKLDFIGMTSTEIDAYLKLDQTTPQTVINGTPQFNKGIAIKENEWVLLDGV